MEDLTAGAGLTRVRFAITSTTSMGLLEARIAQIDSEMTERLNSIVDQAESRWQGFIAELVAYVEMALEPEIRHIVLLDGPALLGDPTRWPSQQACVRTTKRSLEALMDERTIRDVDAEAMARLISGRRWAEHSGSPTRMIPRKHPGRS